MEDDIGAGDIDQVVGSPLLGIDVLPIGCGNIGWPGEITRRGRGKGSAKPLIAKIWNSHDEYTGEAAGNEADGLGVLQLYLLSEEITPSLRSSYAGMHEARRYGPLGVYTFPDQQQFAGHYRRSRQVAERLLSRLHEFHLRQLSTAGVRMARESRWMPASDSYAAAFWWTASSIASKPCR